MPWEICSELLLGDDLLGGIVLQALRLVNGDCIGQLKGDDRKPKEWSSEIPSSYR